jgi:hypothetical protein
MGRGGSKEDAMMRLFTVLALGGLSLSGCVYEVHHDRTVATETRTQNSDGTTTVTRTEVVREAAPSSTVYVAPGYWGWYGYPYGYGPRPGFGFYYGGYPYRYHCR